MKVIVVTSFKGGVGKSTTAIHLAGYFAQQNQKVLLIDSDTNRTCLQWGEKGLLPFKVVDENRAFKEVPGHNVIIRDKQARPDAEDLADLAAGSDLLVLPTTPDVLSLRPMMATAKHIGGNYRVLITICPPPPNSDSEVLRADLESSSIPTFKTKIRRTIGFSKAALEGVLIRDLKDSRARLQIAKHLVTESRIHRQHPARVRVF